MSRLSPMWPMEPPQLVPRPFGCVPRPGHIFHLRRRHIYTLSIPWRSLQIASCESSLFCLTLFTIPIPWSIWSFRLFPLFYCYKKKCLNEQLLTWTSASDATISKKFLWFQLTLTTAPCILSEADWASMLHAIQSLSLFRRSVLLRSPLQRRHDITEDLNDLPRDQWPGLAETSWDSSQGFSLRSDLWAPSVAGASVPRGIDVLWLQEIFRQRKHARKKMRRRVVPGEEVSEFSPWRQRLTTSILKWINKSRDYFWFWSVNFVLNKHFDLPIIIML